MEQLKRCGDIVLVIALTALFCVRGDADDENSCTNSDGEVIPHGQDFIPDFNHPCTVCVCDKRYAISCRTTACSPPPGCTQTKPIPRKCCQFVCGGNDSQPPSVNDNTTVDGEPTDDEDNITNLSLRLVASTVTSFLVLALLLFMVHRLRQRRLMLAMRRFEHHARQQRGDEDEADHYIPAAFLHIECPPYEDPPPPYSPPKPPHILPQDSPPPYRELDSDTSPGLDANANVANNNNNNDQSCVQHRQQDDPSPVDNQGQGQDGGTPCPSGQGSSDVLTAGSGPGATRSRTSVQGREQDSEVRSAPGRERFLFERNTAPFKQEYSLFSTGAARSTGNSAYGQDPQRGLPVSDRVSAHPPRHSRNGEANPCGGNRGGARGTQRTGRSCSFSFSCSPDEDLSLSGIALAPMSLSYHASSTADSGVQTHGSYTASLSRHRARATGAEANHPKSCVGEEADGSGLCEQRMVTKPMTKCDSATQQSHRQLQEELRRNLPPAFIGDTRQQNTGPGDASSACSGSMAVQCRSSDRSGERSDNISPGTGAERCSLPSEPKASASVSLPRSQSVGSTFSVCSETGELHVKKGGGAEGSVLQSDSQYPDHGAPQTSVSPPLTLTGNQLLELASQENPSSLPNYTFPTATTLFPTSGTPPSAGGPGGQTAHTKGASVGGSRRPVPAPPSQELRTAVSVPGCRSHPAKPKPKKIHFVPLEKSKTFKTKKDKAKSVKKGEAEQNHSVHHHDSGSRPNAVSSSHATTRDEGSQPRIHQPKLTEMARGRLPPSVQSVKQYGFLDLCPAPNLAQEGPREASAKNIEAGKDSNRGGASGVSHLVSNPYHSLPHKPHTHSSAANQLAAGHRRQYSHGDRLSHANPSASRSKTKARPLSSGLVVEPGQDPADPATALPQNNAARRRAKTLHLKKGRQAYPVLEGAQPAERKVTCVDMGFVEPTPESCRSPGVDADGTSCNLPSKRRALDRGNGKPGLGAGSTGSAEVEGHMSSYV